MKILTKISAFIFILGVFFACETDEDNLYSLDYIGAPTNVEAVFDITQDNSGLVSISPNAEGAQQFTIDFGDGSETETYKPGEIAEHVYTEGVYSVKIIAVSINGKTTEFVQELNVTFKAPENLEVNITNDTQNPRIVSVTATADFATVFEVYFGDVEDEEPTMLMPGETVSHTYEAAGDYDVRIVAKSAGAATTEYTETVNVPEAADPINLPIDFESFTINYAFENFGGTTSSVIDNPDASGINTSAKVAQSNKSAGAEIWAGSFLTLENPIDFSNNTEFRVKVWSPKAGATVKLKVENLTDGNIGYEVDATTTVANAWEELTYDFSAIDQANEYQKVVIFFDFGNNGDDSNYYFDDIKLVSAAVDGGLAGVWKMAPEAGALGVGPGLGDTSWWSSTADDVTTRACFFDDTYEFGADGSFRNVLGSDTWVEDWQGGSNACGTPVAPHDGSNSATFTYDKVAGTITLEGVGAYLGIPKAYNGGELANPADAPASISYDVTLSENNTVMTLDINVGGDAWWRFKLVKVGEISSPVVGSWSVASEAGALGVGPGLGDTSWWSNTADDVTTRACFFDDTYEFGADGSFRNVLGSDTWIEGWQGGSDACGTPVAPHDGSNAATYTYDAVAGTITLDGESAFLGIPKAYNGGELANPADAPASITYDVALSDNETVMTVDINVGGDAWWRFKLVKN
ncbi:hypothetical protein [Marinifilum fragile]|uniref:hypothetical protein n=1 Tax=Marinifilum fragile TaxID=570161 RepID=UPI002AABAE8C|nr:hypothetical protein [Marinifilum fragile]